MKETLFIGSKFSGHDSAIFFIFPEKKEIFAIETERLTRYKHDIIYPIQGIIKLLEYKKIDSQKIKKVYFSNSVVSQKNEIVVKNELEITKSHRKHFKSNYFGDYIRNKSSFDKYSGFKKFINLIKTFSGLKILRYVFLKKLGFNVKEIMDDTIRKHLRNLFPNAELFIDYSDHHFCHALSSYFSSNFDDSVLVTSDGFGDDKFSSVYTVVGNKISYFSSSKAVKINLRFDGINQRVVLSVGNIYSFFTEQLGYKFASDEGKVEALAAYGSWNNEVYHFLMKNTWIEEKINSICFNYKKIEQYLDYKNFIVLIEKYKKQDLAAAVQKYLEDIHLIYIKHIIKKTGINNLCFSGGVAANVILNLRIYEEITKNLHIPPAMADDGSAEGAAISILLNNGYDTESLGWIKNKKMPYFSTSYSKSDVLEAIKKYDSNIKFIDLGNDWPKEIADMVADGKIGAIFHGKMEWGPRALGNRSIVADSRRSDFRKIINLNIKKRPEFQPFCPSILLEEKDRLFIDAYNNKHMTCAFRMKNEFWDKLPGAIHIDGTSRVQFVEEEDNPKYYQILKRIKKLTGFGVVINTSFNKHGRTIVESPHDALVDFYDTNLDFLIIEGILIKK